MGSAGVQAGAGMFTGFLQVWHAGHGSLRKKICPCSAGSKPICERKELLFLVQVNGAWHELWHDQVLQAQPHIWYVTESCVK